MYSVGYSLCIHAAKKRPREKYIVSEGQFMPYLPLHNKDLSEIGDLICVMKVLNAFVHSRCSEMTEEVRSTLPIVRSRSSSVVSTPSYNTGDSEHRYSL